MERKNQRNGFIDILRMLFAIIIMMYHFFSDSGVFISGLYAVEFFVILAGFLFYASWAKMDNGGGITEKLLYWKSYMLKRYWRYFLYNLVAFIPMFLAVRVWWQGARTVSAVCEVMTGDVWEVLLIKIPAGLNGKAGLLNSPIWVLETMLLAQFLILGMLVWIEKPYLTLLMPLTVILGTGFYMHIDNAKHYAWAGVFTVGALRVYLLMCFGIISYWICQWLKRLRFNAIGRWCLTAAELLSCLGYILALCVVRGSKYHQFCITLAVTVIVAIVMSGKSETKHWFPQSRLTGFCAEWSLALYMTHCIVLYYYKYTYSRAWSLMIYQQKYLAVGAALGLSLVYLFIMRGIFRLLPYVHNKTRDLFLERD